MSRSLESLCRWLFLTTQQMNGWRVNCFCWDSVIRLLSPLTRHRNWRHASVGETLNTMSLVSNRCKLMTNNNHVDLLIQLATGKTNCFGSVEVVDKCGTNWKRWEYLRRSFSVTSSYQKKAYFALFTSFRAKIPRLNALLGLPHCLEIENKWMLSRWKEE